MLGGGGGGVLPYLSPFSDLICIKMIRNVLMLFGRLSVCLNVIYFYFSVYILFFELLFILVYLIYGKLNVSDPDGIVLRYITHYR